MAFSCHHHHLLSLSERLKPSWTGRDLLQKQIRSQRPAASPSANIQKSPKTGGPGMEIRDFHEDVPVLAWGVPLFSEKPFTFIFF